MKKYWFISAVLLFWGPVADAADEAVASDAVQKSTEPESVEAPPVKARTGLNEMKGKLASISYDPKTLRLTTDSGFNVEFTYDAKSVLVNGGKPIKMDNLSYDDVIIVRYSGKELYAVEIDRVSRAHRPQ